MRTRIKICGLTRVEDAQAAAAAGCDAVGLVFHPASPRALALAQARRLVEALPPFVTPVALFLDDDSALVEEVIRIVRPACLQFHGSESADYCDQFGLPYIKAISVAGDDIGADQFPNAGALLLDSHQPGGMGGTGRSFDWNAVSADIGKPLVLAGGLTSENVGEAIAQLRPYAVDVSSGVEQSPGIKDNALMQQFIQAVKQHDAG